MDFALIRSSLPFLLQGAAVTLQISTLAVVLGIGLGTIVGIIRLSKRPVVSALAMVYVEFLRGTPLLVQLFLLFYGLPTLFDLRFDEKIAGILAFGVNSSAYVGEIVRAGILSIDRGQMEAARSLGMSYWTAMRYVILPQAFTHTLPPLLNEFITLLKNSSLVAVISVTELTRAGQMVATRTFKAFEMYGAVAVIYLVMTLFFSRLSVYLERRLRLGD